MAPYVPYLLELEVYESMLADVKANQSKLSNDLSALDMTTNEGHTSLLNAGLVSGQLREYRHNVECKIKYFTPQSEPMINCEVYTTTLAHSATLSTRRPRGI